MVQTLPKLLTFDEFMQWHPEDGRIFELIEGIPLEVNPTGPHEQLSGFLSYRLNCCIDDHKLAYFIPKTATLKPTRDRSGFKPDIAVLDQQRMADEPRWLKESTITAGKSAPLVIEIASTNWRDDYGLKLGEYELMGVPEYWIVDYLAIAAARHIGSAKQPTISVHYLIDGEYQVRQFKGDACIESAVLPKFRLTVNEMLTRI
jgi:Uma2 family endonuclease